MGPVLGLLGLTVLGLISLAGCVAISAPAAPAAARIAPASYPVAAEGDVTYDLHGVEIADPYRWLEDSDAPETRAWIEAQNDLTSKYLDAIPVRDELRERLSHLWNFERFGTPYKRGGRYFYTHNNGLQNQSVIYVTNRRDERGRVLLDPNEMAEDGTVSIASHVASRDGKWLAYAVSDGGSDWRIVRFRDVLTGKDLTDELHEVKFSSMTWNADSTGFYYNRYPKPEGEDELQKANYNQKVYYHEIGTSQDQDVLVYERPDQKTWGFGTTLSYDGRWLLFHVWRGSASENNVFLRDLQNPEAEVVELLTDFQASFSFIGNNGTELWFTTNDDAPRGRVVAIDVNSPAQENWREVIAEAPETLEDVSLIGNRLVASYLQDAHALGRIYETDGSFVREIDFPGLGSARGFSGTPDDSETFYSFSGYTMPRTVYHYDVATGSSTVFRKPEMDFKPELYLTEQVFYESKDGTKIPMFLTYKKGLARDGDNPVYLYGYGGFNVSLTPGFSIANVVWMERGGIYAVANLRGGGEYGEEWHKAGTKLQKQNTFDDFIAAGEWLIDNNYTRRERLAIAGGSNGGLLVGACMTQRPDLFGCCVAAVGVMDMLRFHKFTIGHAWQSDFGSPDDPKEAAAIRKYSPLHNLEPGSCYPSTLLTTADRDDRVVPAHSFKFAAALQAAQACSNPTLIRIETRAGHGAGTPTQKRIEEISDRWAFVMRALGMEEIGTEDGEGKAMNAEASMKN